MSISVHSTIDLNIQEKDKNTVKTLLPPGMLANTRAAPTEAQITLLAASLRSPHFTGQVLRVLVRRLRYPENPYTSKDLEILLLVTMALERAGMWP
jgi:hypothetical protein